MHVKAAIHSSLFCNTQTSTLGIVDACIHTHTPAGVALAVVALVGVAVVTAGTAPAPDGPLQWHRQAWHSKRRLGRCEG